VQLVSKISNLCDPDPPTFHTARRTTCNRKMHQSASRGKNLNDKTIIQQGMLQLTRMVTKSNRVAVSSDARHASFHSAPTAAVCVARLSLSTQTFDKLVLARSII